MCRKNKIDLDPNKLQMLANKLSYHFWNVDLTIPVLWNGRLKRSLGRFVYRQREPLKIEMSTYATQYIDREIFIAVLLHELCHYHLFIQQRPFEDGQTVFEQELRRVGAISTNCIQLPIQGYRLICSQCEIELGVMQRFNSKRYQSSCCSSKINKVKTTIGKFHYQGEVLQNSRVNIIDKRNKKK